MEIVIPNPTQQGRLMLAPKIILIPGNIENDGSIKPTKTTAYGVYNNVYILNHITNLFIFKKSKQCFTSIAEKSLITLLSFLRQTTANQFHEFVSRSCFFEKPSESRSCCNRVLLLYPSHHHTHMRGFYNNRYTFRS